MKATSCLTWLVAPVLLLALGAGASSAEDSRLHYHKIVRVHHHNRQVSD